MFIFCSLGRYILFISGFFRHPEALGVYVRRIFFEAFELGYRSLLFFITVSCFLGAVTVVQTAYNLVSPLVPRYIIAVLVRDTTILELSPTIMAIIFAGKAGSHIAGELGTMRVTEQIDALDVMGINPIAYLVMPKVIACMIMFPVLVSITMFFSISGGYLAAIITGELTSTEYVFGLRFDFIPFNITFAMIKSVVFAFMVSSISAYTGYYTKGGAYEVGRASTIAVTASCMAVLCGDYLLAELLL